MKEKKKEIEDLILQLNSVKIQNESLKKQAKSLIEYLTTISNLQSEIYLAENLQKVFKDYENTDFFLQEIINNSNNFNEKFQIEEKGEEKEKKTIFVITPKKEELEVSVKSLQLFSIDSKFKKNLKKTFSIDIKKKILKRKNEKNEKGEKRKVLKLLKKRKSERVVEIFGKIKLLKENVPRFYLYDYWLKKRIKNENLNLLDYEIEKIILEWVEKFFFFNSFLPKASEIYSYLKDLLEDANFLDIKRIQNFIKKNYGFFKLLKTQNNSSPLI